MNAIQGGRALQIASLRGYARDHGVAQEAAVALYERELEQLMATATVKSFVSIIAEKRTKDAIRAVAEDDSPGSSRLGAPPACLPCAA